MFCQFHEAVNGIGKIRLRLVQNAIQEKGIRLEEANMKLIKVPKAPKDFDILAIPLTTAALRMLKMRRGMPDEWCQYLSTPPSAR